LAEAVVVLLLFWKHVFQSLPAFFLFVCWSLLSDSLLFAVFSLHPAIYFRTYEIGLIIDSVMIFSVLVELAWSVLSPIRGSLPRNSWIVIAVLIVVAGFLLWPVAGLTLPAHLTPAGMNFFRLHQTTAILRVLVFLGMAGFSQLLSIGWRNRELQIATGLGLYSIVTLAVSVLHTYQISGRPQYHWLDEVGVASYLAALIYWAVCFSTKEAERQEFTPQMQNLLLAVAGAARSTRIDLSDSAEAKRHNRREP
jgi:hypothetical protein